MNIRKLPFANLRHNMGRTVGLVVLVALLAFVACGGALVLSSLQNGLSSLEARLGADVMVAPDTAKSKNDLQSVLVDGIPGNFYMNKDYVEKIAAREGVDRVSFQYYLATLKAGCCSMPLQIIGFDPETDFTVQPWIARSYGSELGLLDIVTGSKVTGSAGSTVTFYGVECRIVARLDETGTSMDTAVFASNETVKYLISAAQLLGLGSHDAYDPEKVVSTVLVKVADGYSVSSVADDINLHVRGVTAVQTKAMTSGVADGIAGTSQLVGTLMVALWALAAILLAVAFSVLGRSRLREFAVLRVIGASRSALMRIVFTESAVIGVVGALVGIGAAVFVVFACNGALESMLGLPFLAPSVANLLLLAIAVFAITVLVASGASALSARRLARVDAGQILREE